MKRRKDERVNKLSLDEFVEQKQNGMFEDYEVLHDNDLWHTIHEKEFNVNDIEPDLIDINDLDMHELTALSMFLQ